MYQQTHTVQDHDNKTSNKANGRYAQSFVGILQVVWDVVRKIGATVLYGFHTFVASAEHQSSPRDDYWWNSSEVVEDVLKG